MVTVVTLITIAGAKIVKNKIQEHNFQKLLLKERLKEKITALEQYKTERAIRKEKEIEAIQTKKKLALDIVDQQLQKGTITAEAAKQKKRHIEAQAEREEKAVTAEYNKDIEVINAQITKQQEEQLKLQGGIAGGYSKIKSSLGGILGVYTAIKAVMLSIGAIRKKQHKEKIAEDAKEATSGAAPATEKLTAQLGVAGVVMAGLLLAALGVGIGAAIYSIAKKNKKQSKSERMSNLNNEIYTLSKRQESIQTVIDAIDEFDNKLIKTKDDAEALNETLEQIQDKLSSSKSDNLDKSLKMSEQDYYEKLEDSEKANYLKYYQELLEKRLAQDDAKMYNELLTANLSDRTNRLYAQSLAKRTMYNALDTFDLTTTESKQRRITMETIIESSTSDQLKRIMGNEGAMKNMIDRISSVTVNGTVATDILQDETQLISDRTRAYKELQSAFGKYSDIFQALSKAYQEFEVFKEMDEDVLELIDDLKLSNDGINNIYTSYENVVKILKEEGLANEFVDLIDEKTYKKAIIGEFLPALSRTEGDFKAAIDEVFGGILNSMSDYDTAYNAILNQIANSIQVGIQNIGQNVDKLKNTVTNIYSTAKKWLTMSNTEQSEFLAENAELFAGEEGAELQKAFLTGDYDRIREALQNNTTLLKN